MAQVRLVVGDQSSAEVDQLRRTVNALLLVLENLSGTTFTALADFQEALANSISTGTDGDFTTATNSDSYTGTGVELVGLRVMNPHPPRPGFSGQQAELKTASAARDVR
jgi:hypothetical protein